MIIKTRRQWKNTFKLLIKITVNLQLCTQQTYLPKMREINSLTDSRKEGRREGGSQREKEREKRREKKEK